MAASSNSVHVWVLRCVWVPVNTIAKWSEENGFKLSAEKTYGVHFCRKRGLHPDPEIHCAGKKISIVNQVRYLGVVLDKKLTFLPHVFYLRKKCERSLNILKVLSNTSWGADRTSLLRIYRALIRSKLDYGCIVYGSACKSTLQKLNTVHHLALRLCSGAFRTSPVESLYVDCSEMPLDLRRDILNLHYYFKISSQTNHPLYQNFTDSYLMRLYHSRPSSIPPFYERVKDILRNIDLENIDILITDPPRPPWEEHIFKFLNPFYSFDKGSTADKIYQQIFNHHRESFNDHIPVYTDGSKSGNFVSYAYVMNNKVHNHTLHPSFSVFSAELLAVYKALESLAYYPKGKFIIYSDSFSVLMSLSSPHQRSHPLVLKTLNLFDRLTSNGFKVLFCWVPAHVGIAGNELAVQAAKSAALPLSISSPCCDATKYAKSLVEAKWQKLWDQWCNNKLHSIKTENKSWLSVSPRKYDVILTRLRIGHTRYTHCHLLLGERAPLCQVCNTTMTVNHILVDCPRFKNHRHLHFNSHTILLKDILGESPHCGLLQFLKGIGFYQVI